MGDREITVEYDSPAVIKLMQARRHFESLEREVDSWNTENVILAPTRRSSAHADALELFVPTKPALPLLEWSGRFGDGVHNLRSSLDLLAFEMCHLDNRAPDNPRRVYFPITEKESDWREKIKHLGAIPPALLDRVRETQPWHAASPRTHVLALIHGLDSMDKHRSTVDMLALPTGLTPERLQPWSDAPAAHEEPWKIPWLRVSFGNTSFSDFPPSLWDVKAWPLVHFENRMAPLAELQRWLYQQTSGVIQFIAEGEWPDVNDAAPEPSWADLPPWGAQPPAADS